MAQRVGSQIVDDPREVQFLSDHLTTGHFGGNDGDVLAAGDVIDFGEHQFVKVDQAGCGHL